MFYLVSAPLTSVNLLKNDIGEAAADIVRAAEHHGKIQTLCGIKPDQKAADFSGQRLKAADAVLLAYDIKVNAPLTSVNLLRNDIGEAAADIVRAAEQHGKIQTLCGIKPDQEKADFSSQSLKAADAVLLAYDLKVNATLTDLNLQQNDIGDEGAKAIAAVLPRCVQLQNGMYSAPSDARS